MTPEEMTAAYDDLYDPDARGWREGLRNVDVAGVIETRLGVRPTTEAVRSARRERRKNPEGWRKRVEAREGDGPTTQPSVRYQAAPAAPPMDRALEALIALCRKGPRSLDELCDGLQMGPTAVQTLAAQARERGYAVELHGDRLAWHLPEEWHAEEERVAVAQPVGGWHTIAVVGDVHFGSKWCRQDYLKDFCDVAYERGVRTFLQLGDMLDGEYKHGVRELRAHGWDEQAEECVRDLPYYDDGSWYFIDGNHDETYSKASGMVSGAALVERARSMGRHDLHYLGQRRGLLRLDSGLSYAPKVELWHPKKGPSYADSYGVQKKCEGYAPGSKPDFLFVGHWHRYVGVKSRGIHAWACGTFQGSGSAYGNAIGTPPALGGLIVGYTLTEQGTVRDVYEQWRSYYEREEVRRVEYVAG